MRKHIVDPHDYVRYPTCPEDVYKWVNEGYRGTISYSQLNGYERGKYPSCARVKDKNGNWINVIPTQPDKKWLANSRNLPWDAIIATLSVDSDDWLETGWSVEIKKGWILFIDPSTNIESKIKLPGHPQFKWWFTMFAARHANIMQAIDELPEDYVLPFQPDPVPEGPEDLPIEHEQHGSSVEMKEILTKIINIESKLDELMSIFE